MYSTDKTSYEILDGATLTDGLYRWTSNNRIPPEEIMNVLFLEGLISDRAVKDHNDARAVEDKVAIMEYIKARANMSAEAKAERDYEIRAAFGDEAKNVVNVFTGKKVL
jgi:hypothetical protein